MNPSDRLPRRRLPRASVPLSVALCTYNGERWIGQLLRSIAEQTRPPDELVIQDDGSDDETIRIIEDFTNGAPFEVRLAQNATRLGSTANFAVALERSRGQFIALSDQDDIWYPTKLERLVGELELDPTVTMVLSDADLIDEDGRRLNRRLWDSRMVARTLRRNAVVSERLLARRALTTGCTMVIRRRALAAALPFPAALKDPVAPMRHDRWISLIAAAVGTVRAVPEPLLAFRVHQSQETGVLTGAQASLSFGRAVVDATTVRLSEDDRGHLIRALQLDSAAQRADEVGDFEEAATLRSVANHLRHRSRGSDPTPRRLKAIWSEAKQGGYGWDQLGVAAAAGDAVRALRHPGRATT